MTEYEVKNSAEYAADSNAGEVLTTTLWNQNGNINVSINGRQTDLGVAYNLYCPLDSGVRSVTGCTNTADAQIIYYWLEKGYADQITLTAEADDWFRVGRYDYSYDYVPTGKIELGSASNGYGVPSVSELNDILKNKDIVPLAGTVFSGNKTDLGHFIAALNFYCGVKNNSDYTYDLTSSWSYVDGTYLDGTDARGYVAAGFDSYYRIAFTNEPGTVENGLEIYNSDEGLTALGESLIIENLNYGEVIRVDINNCCPSIEGYEGHSIYLDGYDNSGSEVKYHLNMGWGSGAKWGYDNQGNVLWAEKTGQEATNWYTEAELIALGINGITMDLSPDINVLVTDTRSDYWGGSFERGMERVNHIRTQRLGEDAVDFNFADGLEGVITLNKTAEVLSWSDVNFNNINVGLYIESKTAFSSATDSDCRSGGMNFDFKSGNLVVNNSSGDNIAINLFNNEKLTVTLDNSFIYSGYSSGGYEFINSTLDIDGGYYFNTLSTFAATVSGSALYAGSKDDVVTLTNNSALLGNLELGSGSNVLNVESGSIFYGGFSGDKLTVNLTINNAETGAMLVMTSGGESAFLAAAASTINVSVDSSKLTSGGAYVLYSGSMITQVKVNFKVDNGSYQLFDYENSTITNKDYKLVYDTANNSIKLAYAVTLAEITNIKSNPVKELDEDGLTAGDVLVTADFSENAAGKYYSLDNGRTWKTYPDDGVLVTENTTVVFKAVNVANEETISDPISVDCIDKTPPPELKLVPSVPDTEWTNGSVLITASFADGVEIPVDFTEIKYSLDGGSTWSVYEPNTTEVEITDNNKTVYFRAFDKRGNYSEAHYTVKNIDKEIPVFPEGAIIGSGSDWAKEVHVAIDKNQITDNSGSTLTYLYSKDGNDWQVYTDDVKFGENITVYFKVRDAAGNDSEVRAYEITNVDNTAPETPSYVADVTKKTNGNVVLTVTFPIDVVVDGNNVRDVKEIGYSWVDADGKTGSEIITVPADANGSYEVQITVEKNGNYTFYSKDAVGNIAELPVEITNIDKTPPAKPYIEASTESLTNQPVTLNIAFDKVSGDVVSNQYSYTGNDDDWHDCSGSLIVDKNGMVYFRSVDDVGNVSYSEYEVTNIDRTPPAVPVVSSDNDGRITDKAISVWADFGLRTVAKMQYTVNGTDWFDYDPEQPIVAGEGEEAITSITLKAYDLAGNISAGAVVELDRKGMADGVPVWVWSNQDAVALEYSYDDNTWFAYTGKLLFEKNDTVYFRAKDEAGNISASVSYKISNIDDVADDKTQNKVFIDSKYNAQNTYGKTIDGVLLEYGKNAFSSIKDAKAEYAGAMDNVKFVAENLDAADINNLEGVTSLSAVQVVPEGSYTGDVYSYNAKGESEKKLALAGKDYSQLDIEWFKDVSLTNAVKVKDISGGDAEVRTSQRYSNKGRTLTRHTSHTSSANGFLYADGNAAAGDIAGYLNVELKNSAVRSLAGGKKNIAEDSKITDNGKQKNIAVKESSSAVGSAKLGKGSSSGNIENYKTVELQWATVTGLIENNKVDFRKTEKFSDNGKKFTRSIAVKQTLSSDGSLEINRSNTGNIQGYDDIIVTGSQVGNVRRVADDGGSYRKQNDLWKISQDAKTGEITGKLTESMTYSNGGKFSIAGESATANAVENFSKVTVAGARVGTISNNVMLKNEKSFLYTWQNKELYGNQDDYQVNVGNARQTILKSVEKYAANGTLTISDKSIVGAVSGYDKVAVSGHGQLNSITAANVYGIVCGAYEVKYSDNSKNKDNVAASGSVTEVVTVKPAASVKLDGYSVTGNIEGYKSVTAANAAIGGNIELGAAYTAKNVISFKTNDGIVTKSYSNTSIYTNNGSLNLTGSTVAGNVTDYSKVVLDKSVVGNIINNTAVKTEVKQSETWDAWDWQTNPDTAMSLEDFMTQNRAGILLGILDQYAANGSVMLKNDSTAGNISGYKTVKLDGSDHSEKAPALTVGSITAASVFGNVCGSYKYQMANKISDEAGQSGKKTETVTMAPAASVTVDNYDVNGSIAGYKTVKLTDAYVNGNVVLGGSSTGKSTTVYTVDKNGKLTETVDRVITYKQTGSFSAVDTTVAGSVENYNKVEIKNAHVGNISQSDVVKEVIHQVIENGTVISIDSDPTKKLSGAVKLSDRASTGNITNYSSVTLNNGDAGSLIYVNKLTVNGVFNSINGFTGTDKNDSITINKDSVLRVGGEMNFMDGAKDKLTVNGTLVLENNVQVVRWENIAGKGIIATNHELFEQLKSTFSKFEGSLMDLGNTSAGFRGSAFEAADNDSSSAVEWDGEVVYEGWLGIGDDVDCTDAVDYIRLIAEEDSQLTITSTAWSEETGDTIYIGGKKANFTGDTLTYDLKAGGEYLIKISRNDDNSMSYTMSIA